MSADPDRLRAAFQAFDAWLDLDAPARADWSAALAARDPRLHAEVQRLIEGHERATGGKGLPEHAAELLGPVESSMAGGTVLGDYRLERRLGAGGWGEVWLARRDDGLYHGEVAVKVLHAHLLHPDLRQRFRREGQILASLSRPGIARLLDAGVTPEGQPYYVLEYIAGEPIDRWCDARKLDVTGRVRLFVEVCAAVAHAHAHLVVHRDLKPSNILVNAQGETKLLDFGIAKLIEPGPGGGGETLLTRVAGRAMTPEYAAPEQLGHGAITAATDVYALGVVLYELLAGARPFGTDAVSLARRQLADPGVPRLGSTIDANVAAARGADARRVHKALRGDLENIVARALRTAPDERYVSAQALSDDLVRHLRHEPVTARPDAFVYRARKFIRRYWAGVGATAAILVATLAGAAGVWWQAQQADLQRRRAERVKEYLVSVFREQDPFRRGATARTPAQVVSEAVARLDAELDGEPGLRAELLDDLGEIQANLGDLEGARASLEQSLAEQRRLYGLSGPQTIPTLRHLATLSSMSSRVADAERHAREALRLVRRHGLERTAEGARVQARLAHALAYGKGAPVEALDLIGKAQATLETVLGPDHIDTLEVAILRAGMLEQDRHDAQAETALRDVIARIERSLGTDSVRLVSPLDTLALVQRRADRRAQAEKNYLREAALLRKHFGDRDNRLADCLIRYGGLLQDLKRLPEAEKVLGEAERALAGNSEAQRAALLVNRGQLHLQMQRAADAEAELREAFELRRRTLGEDKGLTWFTAAEWGIALGRVGRMGDAESVQREALTRMEQAMGPDAYQNSMTAERLAQTLERAGRYAEAVPLRRRALVLTEARYPQTHALWGARASDLAHALVGANQAPAEAYDLIERSLQVLPADDGASRGRVLLSQAILAARSGDAAEARELAGSALRSLEAALDPEDPDLGRARRLAGV